MLKEAELIWEFLFILKIYLIVSQKLIRRKLLIFKFAKSKGI